MISIITVCFNSAGTIEDTIRSVAEQNYHDIEHIIVDGGSTDGTKEIIASAASVSSYISEADEGIYDAMNKGIAMANGEIIGILNADDFYANGNVLSQVAKAFEEPEINACYADLVYVRQDDTNKVVRYWKSRPFEKGLFRSGWMPAHPTFFCRRSVYETFGNFNLQYKIAADVELLFRLLEQCRVNCRYIPEVIIKMRLGGTTNSSISNIKKQNTEVLDFLDLHYGRVSRLRFFLSKFFERSKQFVYRP